MRVRLNPKSMLSSRRVKVHTNPRSDRKKANNQSTNPTHRQKNNKTRSTTLYGPYRDLGGFSFFCNRSLIICNRSLVTVHRFCYRSRMDTQLSPPKCFICEQKHWASEECPAEKTLEEYTTTTRINPGDKVTLESPVLAPNTLLEAQGDEYCESCGANLTARDRERERRKQYMRKKRAK